MFRLARICRSANRRFVRGHSYISLHERDQQEARNSAAARRQRTTGQLERPGPDSKWVREYIPLLLLGAVVLVAVLCHAATVVASPALMSALAAAAASAAWIRYLIVRKKRAAKAAREQRELFVQSCFDKVDVMPGSPVFEHYIADLLRMDGHRDVRVVGGKGDGGADILSTDPSGRAMAYQCKRQKDPVPIKVIRELQGTLAYEHHGRAGVIVTNNTLTKDAEALALATRIAVIARAQLAEWMDRTRDQIEQQGSLPREGGLAARAHPAPPAQRSGGQPSCCSSSSPWSTPQRARTPPREQARTRRSRRPRPLPPNSARKQ